MEKLQKDETVEDELEKFRAYGFNIDDLMAMMNNEQLEDE